MHYLLVIDFYEYSTPYQPDFEEHMLLHEALSKLTDKQKQVILYKYGSGYSEKEISSILHITRQAVNRLKARGLLALRNGMRNL